MLAMHAEEAFERVSRSIFRIEWVGANGGKSGTAFARTRLQLSKMLVLGTARHVIDPMRHEPVRCTVQQLDRQSNVSREISFDLTPVEAEKRVYVHKKMDLGLLVIPSHNEAGEQFSPDEELPLPTLPESHGLTPGTRVGWAGFPGIVKKILPHWQLCYCEGVVSATVDNDRRLYIVDGYNTWGISGGPVWHWSEERNQAEVVAVVSKREPRPDLPGFSVFEPLESQEALFRKWQAEWDAERAAAAGVE